MAIENGSACGAPRRIVDEAQRQHRLVIGTGWCGGIRATASAASPWVDELHIAEINEERLKEIAGTTQPVTATSDYRQLLENDSIDAVMISTTPEPTHYPIAKESLLSGKRPLVTAEHAKMVMQVYQAADQSAETGLPVELSIETVSSLG